MADKSAIEWTDATWNPIVGCSIVSPGCTNCYAMGEAARQVRCAAGHKRETHYAGTTKVVNGKPVWTGKVALAPDHILTQPLRWKRGRKIFVNSMGDLFHENVPDEDIDKVFAVMALSPQHTFQVLTKRAERMRRYVGWEAFDRIYMAMIALAEAGYPTRRETCERLNIPYRKPRSAHDWWPLPNVWLGVSTERQQEADERIPHLLATPAAVRFISAEPLLGPIDLTDIPWPNDRPRFPESDDISDSRSALHLIEETKLDWVIVGGESGSGARPMHPDWARSLRDQCAAANVPFFFKQWGQWRQRADAVHLGRDHMIFEGGCARPIKNGDAITALRGGKTIMEKYRKSEAGRLLDGKEHNEFPIARSEAS